MTRSPVQVQSLREQLQYAVALNKPTSTLNMSNPYWEKSDCVVGSTLGKPPDKSESFLSKVNTPPDARPVADAAVQAGDPPRVDALAPVRHRDPELEVSERPPRVELPHPPSGVRLELRQLVRLDAHHGPRLLRVA